MKNLYRQARFYYKGLFMWLNPAGYISNVVLRPALVMVMFGLAGRFVLDQAAFERAITGVAIYGVTWPIFGGLLQSSYYDRSFGTVGFFFLSPANRVVSYLIRPAFHIPNSLLSALIGLLAAWTLGGYETDGVHWPGLLLAVLICSLSCSLFTLCLANFAIIVRDWFYIFALVTGLTVILCGTVVPLSALPTGLQVASKLLPLTHGLDAGRSAINGDFAQGFLLRELAVGIVYGLAGVVLFRGVEGIAKRKGTFDEAFT